jgi:quinoprotein glucose dehydrogenase
MAALLAMRQLRRGEIAMFLQDEDPALVEEAKRAVHDQNITGGMAALAASIAHPEEPLLPRVLNANFRLGTPIGAQALAEFAAREDAPEALRIEALQLLAGWPAPPKFDYVTGAPQDLAARDPAPARVAFEAVLPKLEAVKGAAIRAAVEEARRALRK